MNWQKYSISQSANQICGLGPTMRMPATKFKKIFFSTEGSKTAKFAQVSPLKVSSSDIYMYLSPDGLMRGSVRKVSRLPARGEWAESGPSGGGTLTSSTLLRDAK